MVFCPHAPYAAKTALEVLSMLPPALNSLLSQLSAKPERERSDSERKLVKELQQLDSHEKIQKAINEEFGGVYRIFAGPIGKCQCCGSPL